MDAHTPEAKRMRPNILAPVIAAIGSSSDLVKQDKAISDGYRNVPYPLVTIQTFGCRLPTESTSMRWMLFIACSFFLLPSLIFLCDPAQAQEIELGQGLFCDTQQEVERFVALYDGNAQAAMSAVNTEAGDPNACGLADIAFVRGHQLATARHKDAAFNIVQILVLGVANEAGRVQSVTPALFYSLFPIEEIEV
jgi:hypothetical protein